MTEHERRFLFTLLTLKCPHCQEVAKFGLTEKAAYLFGFFGIGIGRMVEYQITCGGCGYQEFVQKKDYGSWKNLAERFQDFTRGEITQESFIQFAEDLNLPELKGMIEAGSSWECVCGESNPANFSVCWKCNASSPFKTVESSEKSVNLGGGHPWEH